MSVTRAPVGTPRSPVCLVPPGGVEPPSPDLQSSALPLSYVGMAESQGRLGRPRNAALSNPEHPEVRLFSRQLDVPALSNFPYLGPTGFEPATFGA